MSMKEASLGVGEPLHTVNIYLINGQKAGEIMNVLHSEAMNALDDQDDKDKTTIRIQYINPEGRRAFKSYNKDILACVEVVEQDDSTNKERREADQGFS